MRPPFAVLERLGSAELVQVWTLLQEHEYEQNEVIFNQGSPADTMHLLMVGRVRLNMPEPQGNPVMLRIVNPGETFGELALTPGQSQVRETTATALEACRTLTLGRRVFDRLRTSYPGVERLVVEALAGEVRRLQQVVFDAAAFSAEQRILRRLLDLARAYRREDSTVVVVPVTQEALAAMARTTRPTANVTLRKAELHGLLKIARSRITVLDFDGLSMRAGAVAEVF
jgi:CRP/FNR family transcriptional regulator, cyclic AMP receptor protein